MRAAMQDWARAAAAHGAFGAGLGVPGAPDLRAPIGRDARPAQPEPQRDGPVGVVRELALLLRLAADSGARRGELVRCV